MDNIMKEKTVEFTLNASFDPRYYNIIIANNDLKEWFMVNQDTLVKIGCTNLKSAEEILESEEQDILNNKLIQEFALVAEKTFKVLDYYVDKTLDYHGLSSVAYNVMVSINDIHQKFENYRSEDRKIRKYDFSMIVDILNAVYDADKYNIIYGNQTTSWNGSISDSLTFNVTNHIQCNGFEDPDWSKTSLKLENETLTIEQLYGIKNPNNPDDVEVFGIKSSLIEKVYNEVIETKKNKQFIKK